MKFCIAIFASVVAFGVADAQVTGAPSNGSAAAQAGARQTQQPARNGAERKAQEVEEHINQLHRELHITPAEEAQWDTVAQTMRENAQNLDRAIDQRDASIGTASAVDNLKSYADVVQAHAAAVMRLADSFSPLYSEMSDEQKKLADEIFSRREHSRHVAKN
jgi:hypothetical protein